MATYCPCGCGTKLTRTEARYLKTLDERIEFFEDFNKSPLVSGRDVKEGEAFVQDGKDFREGLIAVHHGADPQSVDRHALKAWIKFADKTQRNIAREMKRQGFL